MKKLLKGIKRQTNRLTVVRFFRFKSKLGSLTTDLEEVEEAWNLEIAELKKNGAIGDEISMALANAHAEEEIFEGEIAWRVSRYWIESANALYVPIPSKREEGMWDHYDKIGRWALTSKGISAVRQAIRSERAARFGPWKTAVAAIWSVATIALGFWFGKA